MEPTKEQYRITEEEKLKLYQSFFKQMIVEGFSHEYIGQELAMVAHAIYISE
jgi:formate hydrogenlyase subunit 4